MIRINSKEARVLFRARKDFFIKIKNEFMKVDLPNKTGGHAFLYEMRDIAKTNKVKKLSYYTNK